MATITRENLGTLHDKVIVKLEKGDYLPSFEKTLKQYAKTANVPGFRKGMVPTGMVRKMYGQAVFGDEVVRAAGQRLENYLKNEKLSIFAQPMILPGESPMKLDMNTTDDVDFAFEIGLKPEFEITPLTSKASLTRYKITVGEKMVDDEVERIKSKYGKLEDQETISSKDEIIYSTYEQCDADGKVYPDAHTVDQTALLEKMPVALQEMLKGKKAQDTLVIRPMDVCTPEELEAFLKDPLKRGPEAGSLHYMLTITKIALLIPRQLDAELYGEVFPNALVTDEKTFRDLIRTELSREYDRVSRDRMHNEIYEMLVHNTHFSLPVSFLKRWMQEGGEKPKSNEEVEHEYGSFEHQLRWTLISDKLINELGISVTRDDVNLDIKTRVLQYFGMEADEDAPWIDGYMAKVAKDDKTIDETYRRLLFEKLFVALESKFDVTEKEVAEEEFFKLPDAHAAHHHHH